MGRKRQIQGNQSRGGYQPEQSPLHHRGVHQPDLYGSYGAQWTPNSQQHISALPPQILRESRLKRHLRRRKAVYIVGLAAIVATGAVGMTTNAPGVAKESIASALDDCVYRDDAFNEWRCQPSATKVAIDSAVKLLHAQGGQFCPDTMNKGVMYDKDKSAVLCIDNSSMVSMVDVDGKPSVHFEASIAKNSKQFAGGNFDSYFASKPDCEQQILNVTSLAEENLVSTGIIPADHSVPVVYMRHSIVGQPAQEVCG